MGKASRREIMRVLSKLKKLNKREKYIVYGAAGLIVILIVIQFIVNPFFERKEQM
jgi:type II secretory pathway component PulM